MNYPPRGSTMPCVSRGLNGPLYYGPKNYTSNKAPVYLFQLAGQYPRGPEPLNEEICYRLTFTGTSVTDRLFLRGLRRAPHYHRQNLETSDTQRTTYESSHIHLPYLPFCYLSQPLLLSFFVTTTKFHNHCTIILNHVSRLLLYIIPKHRA